MGGKTQYGYVASMIASLIEAIWRYACSALRIVEILDLDDEVLVIQHSVQHNRLPS